MAEVLFPASATPSYVFMGAERRPPRETRRTNRLAHAAAATHRLATQAQKSLARVRQDGQYGRHLRDAHGAAPHGRRARGRGSGLNEKEIEKGRTLSVLLTEQRTRTAKERHMATRVDHVRDELKALKAYGRLGRAKARLGEANTLTSDDFDDAGGGNVCWPSARGGKGGRDWRDASTRLLIYRGAGGSAVRRRRPVQALAPLDKRHESYPWDVQWPPDAADKVLRGDAAHLARVSSIVATTEEASICSSGRCTRTWSS